MRSSRICICVAISFVLFQPLLRADIFRWDNGQLIPGTEGITPGPGVQLGSRQLGFAELSSLDLTSAFFRSSNLTSAHFINSNLTNVDFAGATLTNADLSGAIVMGADLRSETFTKEQLYSTGSYQQGNLQSIALQLLDFTGGDLSGQNLTNAFFLEVTFTDADFSDALISGAYLHGSTQHGFTKEQLYSTASYRQKNLRGIGFGIGDDLAGWDLSGQDLTGARFHGFIVSTNLTNADFSGAILDNVHFARARLSVANFQGARVSGTIFQDTTSLGFTKEQLYSTASYQQKDLLGIILHTDDLTGWNFRGQDLTNSVFTASTLADASFSEADLRLATGFNPDASTLTRNTIRPDGEIRGLDLTGAGTLTVRDFELGIHVTESFVMAGSGVLELVLQDSDWGSTIAVGQTISPQLGGTLRIELDPDAILADLIDKQFDLFDWPEPLAAGNRFATVAVPAGTVWDLSQLYTTGEVTFFIPEPASAALIAVSALLLIVFCCRSRRLTCRLLD